MLPPSTKDNFPRVVITGDDAELMDELCRRLSEKGCVVKIVESKDVASEEAEYFTYVFLSQAKEDIQNREKIIRNDNVGKSKRLVILPFVEKVENIRGTRSLLGKLNENLNSKYLTSILFVGDIVDSDNNLTTEIGLVWRNEKDNIVFSSRKLYPVSLSIIGEKAVDILFSLRAYGSASAIISRPIFPGKIVNNLKEKFEGREISFSTVEEYYENHKTEETFLVKTSEREIVGNLVKKYFSEIPEPLLTNSKTEAIEKVGKTAKVSHKSRFKIKMKIPKIAFKRQPYFGFTVRLGVLAFFL